MSHAIGHGLRQPTDGVARKSTDGSSFPHGVQALGSDTDKMLMGSDASGNHRSSLAIDQTTRLVPPELLYLSYQHV